jgi:membrane protease YdiL (CAAX protease family)
MNAATHTGTPSSTNDYLIGSSSSVFSISRLRVRPWPILAVIGLGLVVLLPAALVGNWVTQRLGMERSTAIPWLAGYVNHAVMLVIALVLIIWFSKGHVFYYGLQWPRGKHYALSALAWGAFFGVLMTVVDYFPQILKHMPPPENLSLAPVSVAAWLFAEAIYVGPTEEIPFRGLLQTFLMQRTSGQVRLWKFEMHVAGVILALLFALAHVTSFWSEPFWPALGQQVYGFALGVLYAYWREKSGSLLAPIIGHNLSDGVEYALMFLMTLLWR